MQDLGFRVFMFLDMSLGLLKRPKRALELTLKIWPRAQTRATMPRPKANLAGALRRSEWVGARITAAGGNLGFRV